MAWSRTVLRVILATAAWWMVLYPAVAAIATFLLPPDPITLMLVFGPSVVVAVLAGVAFVFRSGSLRPLVRFGAAVFLVSAVVGLPLSTVFQRYGEAGLPLAVLSATILVVVSYTTGYYLVYEGGYERLKVRATSVDGFE